MRDPSLPHTAPPLLPGGQPRKLRLQDRTNLLSSAVTDKREAEASFFFLVHPAWVHSCGWKSHPQLGAVERGYREEVEDHDGGVADDSVTRSERAQQH